MQVSGNGVGLRKCTAFPRLDARRQLGLPDDAQVLVSVGTLVERKGFGLNARFIFIDGRTGATLFSQTFAEAVMYDANRQTPALSSYFELMDRLIPSFLATLSSQKIKGTRILLQ